MAALRLIYALPSWIICGIIVLVIKFVGLFVVTWALKTDKDMAKLKIWGNDEIPADYDTGFGKRWVWYAWRNAAHYFTWGDMPEYKTYGDSDLESNPGWQWRYRHSNFMDSFRMTWGKPDAKKGKDEFYIGFKLNDEKKVNLTFFQLRPAWLILIPIVIWWFLR